MLAALSILAFSSSPALADTTGTNAPVEKTVKTKAEKKADKAAKDGKPYPFHGIVAAVDKKALTFTLEGKEKPRVISLSSKSLFEKDGKPATFSQIAVGDYAHGRLEKQGDGEVLVKAAFGPKPEKKAKAEAKETKAEPATK